MEFGHPRPQRNVQRCGALRGSWRGCTFEDVSAGGLALGDVTKWDVMDTAQWDMDLHVEDCVLANLPAEYTGAGA